MSGDEIVAPDGKDAPPGVARVYRIADTQTHAIRYLPSRPLSWLLIRYVSATSTDTCEIGLGNNPTFPLLANEPPVVLRSFDPTTTDLSFSSTGAVGSYLYLLGA